MQEKDRHEVVLLIFWSRGQTADILYVAISCAHLVEVFVFDCSSRQANRDMNFCNSDLERGGSKTHESWFSAFWRARKNIFEDLKGTKILRSLNICAERQTWMPALLVLVYRVKTVSLESYFEFCVGQEEEHMWAWRWWLREQRWEHMFLNICIFRRARKGISKDPSRRETSSQEDWYWEKQTTWLLVLRLLSVESIDYFFRYVRGWLSSRQEKRPKGRNLCFRRAKNRPHVSSCSSILARQKTYIQWSRRKRDIEI